MRALEMSQDPVSFEQVRETELRNIRESRGRLSLPTDNIAGSIFGIAFSGGGIRSATFNLGVVQALARVKLLQRADYLSTVSGGGYVGSWLSAWIRRREGNIRNVEEALNRPPNAETAEAKPITWLRRYSNYLTARVGFLSTDTLAGAATFARNLLLNLIELVGLLAVVLILPLLLGWVLRNTELPWMYLGAIAFSIALFYINLNFYKPESSQQSNPPWYQSRRGVFWLVVVPQLIAGTALGFAVARAEPRGAIEFFGSYWWKAFVLTLGLQLLAWLYHASKIGDSLARVPVAIQKAVVLLAKGHEPTRPAEYRYHFADWVRIVAGVAVAVSIGLLGLWLFQRILHQTAADSVRFWHATAWALPAAITAYGLASVLFIGIVGRTFAEETREWWARLGGWLIGILIAWIVVVGSAVYGPYLIGQIHNWMAELGVAWIVSTAAGVIAGRSRLSAGTNAKPWVEWIAKAAPYVFIVGLLLGVSFLVNAGLSAVVAQTHAGSLPYNSAELRLYPSFENYAQNLYSLVEFGSGMTLVAAVLVLLVVVIGLARTVDVNVFSFHMFYRNRLVRCYLGASNDAEGTRREHPFTGFDPGDSPKMSDLAGQRPYHIINTAINLTRTRNLAWQERKAASFTISPLFCGYDLNPSSPTEGSRYQSTADYLGGAGWLASGTALTISGAAASPNMGHHTSPATAFLMTVFNVRLGWWMQNTQSLNSWTRKGPSFGILWLVRELFAMADETRPFVYLSDGGHFENLGIYELVRRRCRFILAVDAGHDSEFKFEDLGNAVRKCQVDLGTRIDIDTRAIIPDPNTGRSLFHCAVGEINYPSVSGEKHVGMLLYIKPSLTGNEPADVTQYAAAHPDFPHQTTADQWFNESQFESYRKLGQHILSTILEPVQEFEDPESIFVNLKERWYSPSRAAKGSFTRHGEQLKLLEQAMRDDVKLQFLDIQLFPEWSRLMDGKTGVIPTSLGLPAEFEKVRAGFYLCTSVLQLMENVYLDLDLEEDWNHPDNRGWMNLFKHWTWSSMFMVTFSISCGMYGARFQRWCERHLDMRPGKVEAESAKVPASEQEREPWLGELEKGDDINFVEKEMIREHIEGADTLVMLRMNCSSPVAIPPHRGGSVGPLLSYTFGIALVKDANIVFFRIQDHLRRMGLGRQAMRALVEQKLVKGARIPRSYGGWQVIEGLFHSVRTEHG